MIIETLKEQWLSDNEAKTYVAVLSLWIATISEIARKVNERRENVYYTLENLQKKWYISCITKNKVNNYTALDPRELHEKVQNKANDLLANIPELLALMPKIWWKMSVNLYEWLEWFKIAYEHVVLSSKYMADDEYFLWFVGTQHINKALERYLINEWVPWRLKFKTKTRAIIDRKSIKHESGSYSDLSNKPSIPSSSSDLSDGSDLVKKSSTTGLLKNDGSVMTGGTGSSNYAIGNHTHSGYISTSSTTGLVKNDGTIMTSGTGSGNYAAGNHTHSGYVSATKVTSWQSTPSDSNVPSEKLVKDYVDGLIGSAISYIVGSGS